MAIRVIFARRALTIAGTAGRLVLPPVTILPQTSAIEVRIARPTTLAPLVWGSADVFETRIVLELDGEEEHVCIGRATGGVRLGKGGIDAAEYVLRLNPTWGFFGRREGLPTRLGERSRNFYRARIEITSLDGAIDSNIIVLAEDEPAPNAPFRSSVAFDATTSAQEAAGDGVLSLSHTSSGANLGVFAAGGNGSGDAGSASTSCTYAGTSMTEMWDILTVDPTNNYAQAGYRLAGQATGAQTVTQTLATIFPSDHALGVISMTGVHQTTPVGTPATSITNSATPSVTVPSVGSGDLVVDFFYGGFNLTTASNPGANQTERTQQAIATTFGGWSTQLGSDGGIMSWALDTTPDEGTSLGAVAFKPSAVATGPEDRIDSAILI